MQALDPQQSHALRQQMDAATEQLLHRHMLAGSAVGTDWCVPTTPGLLVAVVTCNLAIARRVVVLRQRLARAVITWGSFCKPFGVNARTAGMHRVDVMRSRLTRHDWRAHRQIEVAALQVSG